MVNKIKTVLWENNSPAPNNSSITLNDSIDNYDEIEYYGSGARNALNTPCVITNYPVISGVLNLGGPEFIGKWGSGDTWILSNGTQCFLSGNSGYIASSYFFGRNNGATGYAASLVNNRVDDVRPYKIVGIKYKNNNSRTLLWEKNGSTFNTSVSLSEDLRHFDSLEVYGSGYENTNVGCYKTAKNTYTTQRALMLAGPWCYTPWKIAERHNLLLTNYMNLSGNSGYISSGMFFGMGNQTTAWAAGRWSTDNNIAIEPYKIYGVNRKPHYNLYINQTEGGTVNGSLPVGYYEEICTLYNTPESEDWKLSSYNITGATLTGDQFTFETSDVKVQGNFEHNKTLTLIDGEHAVLSADKDKGFIGDVVTVTGTMDEGWYLTGFNTTGATMTGNQFAFAGEDVTVEGLYTDEGFPVVYEAEDGVHLEGSPIAIPGQGITLTTSYDTYYRTNGYDITGGYIENGLLYATAACTARLKSKVNTFTASGGWEKGSDVTVTGGNGSTGTAAIAAKYATVSYHTSNVPTAWYNTSNRWKVTSTVSAYKITLNPTISMSARAGHTNSKNGYWLTGVCLLGSTQTQAQGQVSTHSTNGKIIKYSKSFTASNTGVNYGVSGLMKATGGSYNDFYGAHSFNSTGKYIAARTTGTWVATGIAP